MRRASIEGQRFEKGDCSVAKKCREVSRSSEKKSPKERQEKGRKWTCNDI